MYGLIIEGIKVYVVTQFGEDVWEKIVDRLENKVQKEESFTGNSIYSESLPLDIANATSQVLGLSLETVLEKCGEYFIAQYVQNLGYDEMIQIVGRHLRDFLNGLDNLHEYLRFSFPHIKAPSFFCVNEGRKGLTLQYRSKRDGYIHYVKGLSKGLQVNFIKLNLKSNFFAKMKLRGSTI